VAKKRLCTLSVTRKLATIESQRWNGHRCCGSPFEGTHGEGDPLLEKKSKEKVLELQRREGTIVHLDTSPKGNQGEGGRDENTCDTAQ